MPITFDWDNEEKTVLFGDHIVSALLKVKGLTDVYRVAMNVTEARQWNARLNEEQAAEAKQKTNAAASFIPTSTALRQEQKPDQP